MPRRRIPPPPVAAPREIIPTVEDLLGDCYFKLHEERDDGLLLSDSSGEVTLWTWVPVQTKTYAVRYHGVLYEFSHVVKEECIPKPRRNRRTA